MHEYGCFKLLEFSNGWTEEFFDEPVINYGMIAPLNFVASVEIMVLHIYELSHLYILPYSIIKNPVKLLEYYRNNEIKAGYLPPSYIRVLGDKIKDNSIGELCFAVPFTRGYINLSEQTKKAFIDGIYHTGDLAHRLPDGNFVLDGRSNDMIKINGNRIEPAEIEAAFKKITGVNWCAAKGIEEKRRSYVCLYYTENIDFNEETINARMQNQLPSYMIPSYI